jgi:uncharacterized protein (DUF983 family)
LGRADGRVTEKSDVADNSAHHEQGRPELISAALFGLCPRCGARTLYRGLATFALRCTACGLDYSRYNVGDGPAAILTLVVGALIVLLALIVELKFTPPFWVHILLWVPLTTAAVIGLLRIAKAGLLYLEHRNEAQEGRLDPEDEKPS